MTDTETRETKILGWLSPGMIALYVCFLYHVLCWIAAAVKCYHDRQAVLKRNEALRISKSTKAFNGGNYKSIAQSESRTFAAKSLPPPINKITTSSYNLSVASKDEAKEQDKTNIIVEEVPEAVEKKDAATSPVHFPVKGNAMKSSISMPASTAEDTLSAALSNEPELHKKSRKIIPIDPEMDSEMVAFKNSLATPTKKIVPVSGSVQKLIEESSSGNTSDDDLSSISAGAATERSNLADDPTYQPLCESIVSLNRFA